jgi:hypothetical protein
VTNDRLISFKFEKLIVHHSSMSQLYSHFSNESIHVDFHDNANHDRFVLSQYKKRIVDDCLRLLSEDRLQQSSFQAISQYLKEATEIDYETFATIRDLAPKNAKQYFTPKVFLNLRPDNQGYINSETLIRY